jgi:hypothetical protein
MFLETQRKEDNDLMFPIPPNMMSGTATAPVRFDWNKAVQINLRESLDQLQREILGTFRVPAEMLKPQEDWRAVLEEAANIIEKRGHTKNQFEDHQGAVCAYHAVCLGARFNAFNGGTGEQHDLAFDAMRRVMAFITGTSPENVHEGQICNWNNEPGTDGKQVSAVMRAVARAA